MPGQLLPQRLIGRGLLVFLPRYGYPAAAAITIVAEIVEGLAFYWYLRRSLGPIPWAGWLWRPWLSVSAMLGVTYAVWHLQPLVALASGLGVYALGLAGLRAFTLEEQAILAQILPARLRQRLGVRQAEVGRQ